MIAASNLCKNFDRIKAVDDISFEVAEGENLVLLGTSGSGKTTLLRMINRLIEPSGGRISISGVDVSVQQPEELRRKIGYVLQHNSLFPHYTVAENIAIVPRLLHWDKKKIADRTEELMQNLHLSTKYLPFYPHRLSGGQQQRVNIARALAADPPILLMDEPFGALDNITRAMICKDFIGIEKFMRKTIVMVTHDVQEAFLMADRIGLMKNGKLEQVGKPGDLLFHPQTKFVKEFFNSSFLRLALGVVKVYDIWGKLPGDCENSDIVFSCNHSLWKAMEAATQSGGCLTIENGKATKKVTGDELFKAFLNHSAALQVNPVA